MRHCRMSSVSSWMPSAESIARLRIQWIETERCQRASQPDHGQTDQRGRIFRFDRFEQGDAECLGLESAGTVKRRLLQYRSTEFATA